MSNNEAGRQLLGILEDIIVNVRGIIRSKVRLAKAEMQEESIKAGKAAGVAVSGALLALYAVGFLCSLVFLPWRLPLHPGWLL